jgi:TonB family protein
MKFLHHIFFLTILINLTNLGNCQSVNSNNSVKHEIKAFDIEPEFPGGSDSLISFVKSKAIFPKELEDENIVGRVYVQFAIDTNGTICDIELLRGINEILDSIAIEIVKNMPNWSPAYYKGKPVESIWTLPVKFEHKINM